MFLHFIIVGSSWTVDQNKLAFLSVGTVGKSTLASDKLAAASDSVVVEASSAIKSTIGSIFIKNISS